MKEATYQLKVSCSLFTRILLVKDAQSRNRAINDHLNYIFKIQIDAGFPKIESSSVAVYFLEPIVSKESAHKIIFDIKKSLYDAAITTHSDKNIHHNNLVQDLAEMAVNYYVFSGLSGNFDEQGQLLNKLAIETLKEIEVMNHTKTGDRNESL